MQVTYDERKNRNRIILIKRQRDIFGSSSKRRNSLDAKQVLSVIEKYSVALDLLDDYDHQTMKRPKGNEATYVLSYEECRNIIDQMKFGDTSTVFGNEKDDSFKGSIDDYDCRIKAG